MLLRGDRCRLRSYMLFSQGVKMVRMVNLSRCLIVLRLLNVAVFFFYCFVKERTPEIYRCKDGQASLYIWRFVGN